MNFARLWERLLPLGRDPGTGGYHRYSWTPAGAACRDWFLDSAAELGLRVETDRNTNLWAWWDPPGTGQGAGGAVAGDGHPGAVVTGSHLDSVPGGGAFDGALGVAAAFAAVGQLRDRGLVPARPVAVVAFAEEEGSRFGVACLGSRLLAGDIAPGVARALRDGDGTSLAEAVAAAGHDPGGLGADPGLLARIAAFVELHIEQGRAMTGLGAAVAVGEGIWPHGRWRLDFTGRADHAGTAPLAGRRDPVLPAAAMALAARLAAAHRGALATVGKLTVAPGAANAVAAAVSAWLDVRAPEAETLAGVASEVIAAGYDAAREHDVALSARQESASPAVEFDPGLRARLVAALAAAGVQVPVLPTGAGHDAGVLAGKIPTAMLFVRNPTGVSHSPAEHADLADCEAGAAALATVLAELAGA